MKVGDSEEKEWHYTVEVYSIHNYVVKFFS